METRKKQTDLIFEAIQPVLMSRDVKRSIRFHEKLGFTLAGQDIPGNPKYARMQRDAVELHLQWHDAKEWTIQRTAFVSTGNPGRRRLVRTNSASAADWPMLQLCLKHRGVRVSFHVRDPDLNLLQFYTWL